MSNVDEIMPKVLWVDDDLSLVDDYCIAAERFGLDLIHFPNWAEANKELMSNYDNYEAIILDARCHVDEDTTKAPNAIRFLSHVIGDIRCMVKERGRSIPWYVLSAGEAEQITGIKELVDTYDRHWDREMEGYYYKKETNDRNTLFKRNQEYCKNEPSKVMQIKSVAFPDVFAAIRRTFNGTDGFIVLNKGTKDIFMEQKSQEKAKNEGTEAKTRVPHLDRLIKLDACFRNPNPAKCTLEAIQDAFRDDPSFGKPIIKSTLHNYLTMLREDLGAKFKGEEINVVRPTKDTVDGKKRKSKLFTFKYAQWNGRSYYQYADVNAPLPKLQALIGKNSKDSGVALMRALEIEERENMASPLHIWLRLFLDQMINDQSTALNVVSFYENIDLDDQNIHKFERLLKAILDKRPIKIHYIGRNGKPFDPCIQPYRLKNYNQRWYLIGKCYNPQPRPKHPDEYYEGYANYALDSIVEHIDTEGRCISPAIQNWETAYINPDNDELDEYYYDMVGVTASETGPEDVYLRFTPERYAYVASKPIVSSQSKNPVGKDHEHYREGCVTIKLRVHINKELEQQVLSFGPDCEVVAPESFREQVRAKITAMTALYDEQPK